MGHPFNLCLSETLVVTLVGTQKTFARHQVESNLNHQYTECTQWDQIFRNFTISSKYETSLTILWGLGKILNLLCYSANFYLEHCERKCRKISPVSVYGRVGFHLCLCLSVVHKMFNNCWTEGANDTNNSGLGWLQVTWVDSTTAQSQPAMTGPGSRPFPPTLTAPWSFMLVGGPHRSGYSFL